MIASDSGQHAGEVRFILMAKRPVPGAVKSRLVADGLSPADAATVAEAMLECIAERLAARGELVIAVSPDDSFDAFPHAVRTAAGRWVNQGSGDLGARMMRLWRDEQSDRPLAFFGMDSPDVPAAALERISAVLAEHDLAVGPTDDGGYWTLAGMRCRPEVLADIDWGTASVYDATRERAAAAGLRTAELTRWSDVDRLDDLQALIARLRSGAAETERPLAGLLDRLDAIPALQRDANDAWNTRDRP